MHFSGKGWLVLQSDSGTWIFWGQSPWYHQEESRRPHAGEGCSGPGRGLGILVAE